MIHNRDCNNPVITYSYIPVHDPTQMEELRLRVDIHMYSQWANNPLQYLDRQVHVLTVGALLGPHWQCRAIHWHHFTNHNFT